MKKQALITGATSGIGRATALRLAAEGYDIIATGRRSERLESLRREIEAAGGRCTTLTFDVRSEEAVRRNLEPLGRVDLLVNNAGLSWTGLFQDTAYDAWRRLFTVNVDGAYHCIQAVLPRMLHEKEGNIINVTSIWGLHGASCEVAYAATKAALVGLTKSLAAELAPSGIRVNAVAPGCIDSDMLRALGKDTVASLAQETPLGRIGTAEDVAKVVRFLAAADSDFITGQILTADGGFTL